MMLCFCHDTVLLSWCCAVVMMLCLLLCCKSASVFVLTQFIEGIAEKKPLKFFRHKSAPPPSYLYICQHLKLKDLTTRVRFLFKLRKWAEFFKKISPITFLLNVSVSCFLSLVSCLLSNTSPVSHPLYQVSCLARPVSWLLSQISRILFHVSCLVYHVSCLTSLVSCLLSRVACLLTRVLRILFLVCPLSHVSGLTSPVSSLLSPVSWLQSPVSCLSHVSCLSYSVSCLLSHVSLLMSPVPGTVSNYDNCLKQNLTFYTSSITRSHCQCPVVINFDSEMARKFAIRFNVLTSFSCPPLLLLQPSHLSGKIRELRSDARWIPQYT